MVSEEASAVYVSGHAGNDTADGQSWATAKRTISAGVDAQDVVGGKVFISNGTYVVSSEISIDKPVRLYGLNGPEHTIVDGGGSNRCFNLGNSPCLLSGLTITNGFTTDDGGGVYCNGSAPVVSNCVISGNSAAERGGGMCNGTAINCTIRDNEAGRIGGGMAYGVADNCLIRENTATYEGGGLYYVEASHCTIIGNSADSGGGVSGFQYQASGEVVGSIRNCVISGNSALRNGGGVSSCEANNCVISGNTATSFGGGMSYGSANNCTISGNSASQGGGTAWVTVNNCIVWYNTANREPNLLEYSARYCFSPDVLNRTDGNSTTVPMLLSASHTATNSPCRGAGSSAFSSGVDIDGQAWSNPPSIGCDETSGPGTYTGPIELDLYGPDTPFSSGHSVAFTAHIQGAITETRIDFGDGVTVTNSPYIFEYIWETGGDYEVVFTASNNSFPEGVSVTQLVHVISEEVSTIYVSGTQGNDAADGLGWATAKKTIQAGVDAQNLVGGRVVISNGTYVITSEILVDKEIRVVGLNGPDHTIVDGGGSNRCFNLKNIPCMLSGLTITNGFMAGAGGGIYCSGIIPVITNCVISGNSAARGGGMYYGTANHCTISGNAATWSGGGMHSGTARHCTISGNIAAESGGGIYSGTANHCTISGNSATSGAGIYRGTANNCVICRNSSNKGGIGIYSGVANNCTITGNTGSGNHAGAAARNCIIWYNEGEKLWRTKMIYCSSPDAVHGVDGNSTNAPLFMDKDAGNYHLQSNSPCINWGDNSYVNSAVDLDGNPRVVGDYVDMGAYEYQVDLGADSDGDQLPDDWERAYFGYNVQPSGNTDNDAHSNGDEFIAGTDPTNASSFFSVAGSTEDVNGTNCFVVQWNAIPDRLYSIQWSTNLAEGFYPLETEISHPQNSYIPPQLETNRSSFYRLDVKMRPASE